MTSPHADPRFRDLFQFSEWLDAEGLMCLPAASDDRTHEEIVAQYLAETDTNR